MSIESRSEKLQKMRETLTETITVKSGTVYTCKEYFSLVNSKCCLMADVGKGVDIHYGCTECCPSSSKIELLCTPFEYFTL